VYDRVNSSTAVIAIVPAEVIAVILIPGNITTSQFAGRRLDGAFASSATTKAGTARSISSGILTFTIDLRERVMNLG
jgi:hypothetical protein